MSFKKSNILLQSILILNLITFFSVAADSRIRNRKVKEAKKVCKLMEEDLFLSRESKKVFGTERHSLVFEDSDSESTISVIKDKGEKICQWSVAEWTKTLKKNQIESTSDFKFHIDEHRDILVPHMKKKDGGYFYWNISLKDCELNNYYFSQKMDLPKCQTPKKRSKKSKKKNK